MHRLSAPPRRTLIIALGSLTALFVVLNFGVFLNALSSPQSDQKTKHVEVVVLDEGNDTERSEAERKQIEADMKRIEVEMRRLDKELRNLEMDHVHQALDAAREALARKEFHLRRHALPGLTGGDAPLSFHFQFDASDVQLK